MIKHIFKNMFNLKGLSPFIKKDKYLLLKRT